MSHEYSMSINRPQHTMARDTTTSQWVYTPEFPLGTIERPQSLMGPVADAAAARALVEDAEFPHATQPNVPGGHMTSNTKQDQDAAVVTDENVEQQFLWLTNTAGNQLAEFTGGISSTSAIDGRAVEQLRSIAEVATKLADRYEADAVPAPIKADRQNFGLVAPQEDEQKFKDDEDKRLERDAEKLRLDAEKQRETQANKQAEQDAKQAERAERTQGKQQG